MPKTTKNETEQRVQAVYLLLLRRESRQAIVNFATAKWQVDTRTADRYLRAARLQMSHDLAVGRGEARAEQIAIRKDLFNKLYKEEKWCAAFQVAVDEAKLLGLYFTVEDHVKAAIQAGYVVMEPSEAAKASDEPCKIDVGLAEPEQE
jgi:hypothetical protein